VSLLVKLLLALFVLLAGAVLSPPARQYTGPAPVVFVKPLHPRVGELTSVLIAAVPRAATDVQLVADGVRWPTRKVGARSYHGEPIPTTAGPWPLTVQFRFHGTEQSLVAAVEDVRPRK
jgi:hypothetical protein